jgi:hypothetical protein
MPPGRQSPLGCDTYAVDTSQNKTKLGADLKTGIAY